MTASSSLELTTKNVTARGIAFEFEPHPDSDHQELHEILNGKYRRNLKMNIAEMKENERVYAGDGDGQSFIVKNVVENIKKFFISKVVDLSLMSESETIKKVLDEQVSFLYGMKNDLFDLVDAKDFDQANTNYFGKNLARDQPLMVQQTGYFVIYINISQMYPSMDEKFDGNNWSLIHETKQVVTPNPNVVNIDAHFPVSESRRNLKTNFRIPLLASTLCIRRDLSSY